VAFARCIRFSKVFTHILHSYRWPCCEVSILYNLEPSVLHRDATTCMQVCNGVFYGFFVHMHCVHNVRAQLVLKYCFQGGGRHRPESFSRWPVKIFVAQFFTVTFVDMNVMAQPLSHIYPTDSSEC
jgi:hypothetical protein